MHSGSSASTQFAKVATDEKQNNTEIYCYEFNEFKATQSVGQMDFDTIFGHCDFGEGHYLQSMFWAISYDCIQVTMSCKISNQMNIHVAKISRYN